jgi:hypothetical protein
LFCLFHIITAASDPAAEQQKYNRYRNDICRQDKGVLDFMKVVTFDQRSVCD